VDGASSPGYVGRLLDSPAPFGHRRSPPVPLDRFPFVRTRSLDEAMDLCRTLYAPLTAELADRRARFAWEANRVVVDRLVLVTTQHGGSVRLDAPSSGPAFHLDLARAGRGEHTQARRTAPLAAGAHAVMVSPSLPVRCRLSRGYAGTQVIIPRQALEAALEALTGAPLRSPLRFEPAVDVAAGPGANVARMVDFLVDQAGSDRGLLSSPLVASDLVEALLHAVLVHLPHDHLDRLRAPVRPVEPACVRRVEEYIDAHLDRPLTAVELAAHASASVRAIQAAFRIHRGTTPTAFVRERRLELARRRLLSGRYRTVADVALSCGFAHLGRFGATYRARFDELPSTTLAGRRTTRTTDSSSTRGG